MKVLGVLPPVESGLPYLLLSARPCINCSQDSGLFLVSLTGGKPLGYVHPGKIIEGKTGTVLLESRAFFGRCLASRPNELMVFFQKERVDRRKNLQHSVLIAEVARERVHDQLLERGFPKLPQTLQLVKSKQCREIDGRNRLMQAKAMDLRVRNRKNEAESMDSDDTPKENQTDAELKPTEEAPRR